MELVSVVLQSWSLLQEKSSYCKIGSGPQSVPVCPSVREMFITSFDGIIVFIPSWPQPQWLTCGSDSPRWRGARWLWLAVCEIERMTGTQIGVCRVVSCRIMPQWMREAINKIRETQRCSEGKAEQLQDLWCYCCSSRHLGASVVIVLRLHNRCKQKFRVAKWLIWKCLLHVSMTSWKT